MSDAPAQPVKPPIPAELARGYLTAELPPIEGRVRTEPADFEVEEVPLYVPSGAGEHLYLWVEKEGISTDEAVRRLAKRLQVKRGAIGTAGLKDAHAVTRQWISVHKATADAAAAAGDDQLRILESRPHKNKLKVGHLEGNRFRLLLRDAGPHEETARAILAQLAQRGAANYVGLQRFGNDRNTHRLGAALVAEDPQAFLDWLLLGGPRDAATPEGLPGHGRVQEARRTCLEGDHAKAARTFPASFSAEVTACRALAQGNEPSRALRAVPGKRRSFYVAAFQSFLFNAYLTRRLDRVDRLEAGEVATLQRNGAAFVVEETAREQPRCDAGEISPSGPLFGRRLLRPAEGSGPRRDEEAILAEHAPGLTAELTAALGARPLGQRRALRFPLRDVTVEREGDDLRVGFFLPRGCYATSVLEELFKEQTD